MIMRRIYDYIIIHLNVIMVYGFLGYLFIYGVFRLSHQHIIYSYILVLLLGIYLGYHIYLYRNHYLDRENSRL